MAHQRTLIRHGLADYLKAPLLDTAEYRTAAGPRVFPSRDAPISAALLAAKGPALLVVAKDDKRDLDAPVSDDLPTRRLLTLAVEAAALGEDADDVVELIEAQVEAALRANPTLGGLVESIRWMDTVLETAVDGDDAFTVAGMTFQAAYYTLPAADPAGQLPDELLGSWAPNIGPPHKDEYTEIAEAGAPEF